MTATVRRTVACVALVSALLQPGGSARQLPPGGIDVDLFVSVAALDDREAEAALAQIADAWKNGYTALFIDVLDLMSRTNLGTPSAWGRISRLARFLEDRTGQRFGTDVTRWRDWVWSLPYDPHPEYGTFKGRLYGQLDRRFEEFFRAPVRSSIRLDEVEWGGVAVNGIPPLEYPRHVTASEAGYLEDANIVFGVYVDGIARAYPKRILAWHELARDRFGARELTVVYCTLCGTVIPYDSYVGGSARVFGTSGLLYRSNKLMFDAETKASGRAWTERQSLASSSGPDCVCLPCRSSRPRGRSGSARIPTRPRSRSTQASRGTIPKGPRTASISPLTI